MIYTEKIKEQHDEIIAIIRELREDVYSVEDIFENTLLIALRLGQLNHALHSHLKFEDEFLYPCLQASDNDYTKETAGTLIEEMGGLAQKLTAYIKQYIGNPNTIREDIPKFALDTTDLLDKISARIETENKELVDLLNANPACNIKRP
ncbi:hypothetical protein SPSYN_00442 [Sporotomaculum syntrophicum]|uniref:Hemerythrin-like domain-containing protein n=1 Tax=Sporotomaculum syntrophicum TaxID=182264 RepID=A0A9D2WSU0_9FIRM|nr:hemerythrin domain-containing protein [Sporotomaculum syntrophicum]KAF1086723.1 hypothetical protein SPSYN_00442 [Sporotomaculum syntrophicum]